MNPFATDLEFARTMQLAVNIDLATGQSHQFRGVMDVDEAKGFVKLYAPRAFGDFSTFELLLLALIASVTVAAVEYRCHRPSSQTVGVLTAGGSAGRQISSSPNSTPLDLHSVTTDDASLPMCFVIMPISTPEHMVDSYGGDRKPFEHVLAHVPVPAIRKAGFEPISPVSQGSETIQTQIIQNLELADLVLCDMSILNANVFFELDIRTSLDKPVCMVRPAARVRRFLTILGE